MQNQEGKCSELLEYWWKCWFFSVTVRKRQEDKDGVQKSLQSSLSSVCLFTLHTELRLFGRLDVLVAAAWASSSSSSGRCRSATILCFNVLLLFLQQHLYAGSHAVILTLVAPFKDQKRAAWLPDSAGGFEQSRLCRGRPVFAAVSAFCEQVFAAQTNRFWPMWELKRRYELMSSPRGEASCQTRAARSRLNVSCWHTFKTKHVRLIRCSVETRAHQDSERSQSRISSFPSQSVNTWRLLRLHPDCHGR